MIAQAHAKINLFLEVLDNRSDGFHNIETIMAPISLSDRIQITSTENPTIEMNGQFCFPRSSDSTFSQSENAGDFWGENNLVVRAAKQMQERSALQHGCKIFLIKRIPVEAGLGGASSDAATTLLMLNELWKVGLSKSELAEISAELGSDVPFFLQNSFARCSGRGEKITTLDCSPRIPIVICKPPIGLSTAKVYANHRNISSPASYKPMITALNCANMRQMGRAMHNGLELPARELSPWIEQISCQFSQLGSLGHQMSGSGSSYFGLFPNSRAARIASRILETRLPNTFVFMGSTLTPRRY